MKLQDAYRDYNRFFVTFRGPNSTELARKEKVYFIMDPRRNPLRFIANFFEALKIFFSERPNAVISNGGGIAIPFCFIAKAFGRKIIFIESFCRINSASASGKIIYPIADLFLVQWKENLAFYPKARHVGNII